MDLAVATFPLSFLMSNCSALQDLDQQVGHRGVDMGRRGLLGMGGGGEGMRVGRGGDWGTCGLHMLTPVLKGTSAIAQRKTCPT